MGFQVDESLLSEPTGSIPTEPQGLQNQLSRYQADIGIPEVPVHLTGRMSHAEPSMFGDEPPAAFTAAHGELSKPTCHPTYAFLQAPDLRGILPQDLSFLISQGCFIVPQRSALSEFLEQYFLHVHPMLPILNEADVWRSYSFGGAATEDRDRLSILVLQGILFISCSVGHLPITTSRATMSCSLIPRETVCFAGNP